MSTLPHEYGRIGRRPREFAVLLPQGEAQGRLPESELRGQLMDP